ncbi:chloride channel protein [Bacillus alkalicellulosilyticus]|uniref:chloride channel protein n=1 Tax=Alkalihalobacterium alkalicellulosilyticum TaxID=1912214 RepID=UPI0009966EEB|nr:chloride channel protein [Bacillus alkalicellulosilyticus]
MKHGIERYFSAFVTLFSWIIFSGIIGVIVGSLTSLLLTTNDILGDTRKEHGWLLFLLPLGGVLIGYMYMFFGKDSAKGNNLVFEGVQGISQVHRRMGPIVYIGTFITVLFGGSTGREGAAVQMGGSIAESVNRFFKIHLIDKKILLMAGISAGFGSAFGTPITGGIFGMEVTSVGKMKYEAIVPCLVASFTGHYITTAAWNVGHENLVIHSVPPMTVSVVLKVIIVSILFGMISLVYCQLRHEVQRISEKFLKKNHMLRGFIGGLVIIVLVYVVGSREYLGRGIDVLEAAVAGEAVPTYSFLAKLVFTVITMGMGFVGGEAIPLFFMGATFGNTISTVVDLPTSFLAALGMIAVFAGGANTPIACLFLAIEMFDGKGIEFFFIACLISYLVSSHHGLWPSQKIYDPKSRLYNVGQGDTIATLEKKKKQE